MLDSNACRRLCGVLASLLLVGEPLHVRAADVLDLQLDGLSVPVDLGQLNSWSRQEKSGNSDLAMWLNLLDARSRRNLAQLLRAPLLQDRSFGQQLLNSWTGEHLLAELGQLLRQADNSGISPAVLRQTVETLLRKNGQLNTLDLLQALPGQRIALQLDGVIALAQQWRDQLELQQQAWRRLAALKLPRHASARLSLSQGEASQGIATSLSVSHRREPLPLELWPAQAARQRDWVVLMPGLGGSRGQLSWLAAALAHWGWPVVVLDHPGSDASALQASLVGQRPPPGGESLNDRLADVEAVLAAQRRGQLGRLGMPPGSPVVLMGHSLGGLTALLAAGQEPEAGLAARCRGALRRLPLTNLSRLLQCQLAATPAANHVSEPTTPIAAVVAFNSFGSLLWPQQGLAGLKVPALLVGGSLDLITPPLIEQLNVLAPQRNRRSRLVLVDGASHFSVVRMGSGDQALFQLGNDLVGVDPIKVQSLLLQLTTEFLLGLDDPLLLSPQIRQGDGVQAHVLDLQLARRWQRQIRTPDADPAAPRVHRP